MSRPFQVGAQSGFVYQRMDGRIYEEASDKSSASDRDALVETRQDGRSRAQAEVQEVCLRKRCRYRLLVPHWL